MRIYTEGLRTAKASATSLSDEGYSDAFSYIYFNILYLLRFINFNGFENKNDYSVTEFIDNI